MKLGCWSITRGFQQKFGALKGGDVKDPIKALDYIAAQEGRGLFVLRDYHAFLNDPTVVRKLRELAQDLRSTQKHVFLLSAVTKIPPEFEKDITIVDWNLPNRPELNKVLVDLLGRLPQGVDPGIASEPEGREQIVDAALGLTKTEAENVLAKSLVRSKTFDLRTVLGEKKHIIRKSGILEYYEAEDNLDSIGGMEILKNWLIKRPPRIYHRGARVRTAFAERNLAARRARLREVAHGKSSRRGVEHAAAPARRRQDHGRSGRLVGRETSARRLKTAEAVAPAILWLDEMEKGFSGTGSSNMSDGGTTSRVFGTFVTWMQEKTSPVFVIATANDVRALPPELLRKGRFDEIFFVDLPSQEERGEVLKIHMKKKGRNVEGLDMHRLVEAMPDFAGSEIEQVVISALYEAFDENPHVRELSTEQLLHSAKEIVPLAVNHARKDRRHARVGQDPRPLRIAAGPGPGEPAAVPRPLHRPRRRLVITPIGTKAQAKTNESLHDRCDQDQ